MNMIPCDGFFESQGASDCAVSGQHVSLVALGTRSFVAVRIDL
jgi:hypothetical protein